MILSISASLLLLAITMQLVGRLSLAAIGKGTLFMVAFAGFVLAMVAISKYANGTEIVKIGATLLALSVSVAILAAVSIMLGMISLPALAKVLLL